MVALGLVLAGVAALLHVYIFVMESLTWTSPRTRATFGTTAEQADATRELAYNQGFYNLFLAVVTAVGIALVVADEAAAGAALVYAGAGSMVAAGLVLLTGAPGRTRAALVQLTPPLLGLLALTAGLLA